ncbi:unnamed protein product [Dracunculus medinensis]|uniref:Uncharacterized protein n=1 Tax=Dracunculus medinensis TaxID=318479 RepID=A0A0N4UFN4_DRAME|nr:unnamed protein product [Dracunculus medinensis]
MARHVAECLEQFNTGLDKVLQARQLLEGSQHLPVDDRKLMMRVLNQAIRTGRKRLSVQDEHETDGRSNDNPNNFSNLCQGIASLPTSNEMSMSSQIDPATFLQQHGHQLLMFLQQNMAKQN